MKKGNAIKALIRVREDLFSIGDFAFVYFLMLGEELVYVGQTVTLASRISDHRRQGRKFDAVYFLLATSRDAEDLEGKYIHILKPSGNLRQSSSRGRRVVTGEVSDGTLASRESRRLSKLENDLNAGGAL